MGWSCVGVESGTLFDDIDLNELEWADYDEKAGLAVEINELSFQFARAWSLIYQFHLL